MDIVKFNNPIAVFHASSSNLCEKLDQIDVDFMLVFFL